MNKKRSSIWGLTPIVFLVLAGCEQPGPGSDSVGAAPDAVTKRQNL